MNPVALPLIALIEDVDGMQSENEFFTIEDMMENHKDLLAKCIQFPGTNHYETNECGGRRSARLIINDQAVEEWVLGKFPEQKELI